MLPLFFILLWMDGLNRSAGKSFPFYLETKLHTIRTVTISNTRKCWKISYRNKQNFWCDCSNIMEKGCHLPNHCSFLCQCENINKMLEINKNNNKKKRRDSDEEREFFSVPFCVYICSHNTKRKCSIFPVTKHKTSLWLHWERIDQFAFLIWNFSFQFENFISLFSISCFLIKNILLAIKIDKQILSFLH